MLISNLLLLLALPLLLRPWIGGPERSGLSVAQLVLAGFGLAALHQGTATLDPAELRVIAAQSSPDAWFVGISAGLLLTAACAGLASRGWRWGVAGVPLAVGAVLTGWPHIGPLATGIAFGAIPALFARVSRSAAVAHETAPFEPAAVDRWSLVTAILTLLVAAVGPATIAMLGLAVLLWRGWMHADGRGRAPRPVLPAVATVLVAVWLWLLITIAATPFATFRQFAADAPLSLSAAQLLALIAFGWGVAAAAPWPLDRVSSGLFQLPVVAVLVHLASAHVSPEGTQHWQPVLSIPLVVAVLAAIGTRRWDGAAGALLLLGATRGNAAGFVGAMLISLTPAARRLPIPESLGAMMAGVAVALVVVTTLRDQVLLTVLLALGVAILAIRHDHVVARAPGSAHL